MVVTIDYGAFFRLRVLSICPAAFAAANTALWLKDDVQKRRKPVREGHWCGLTSAGDWSALWLALKRLALHTGAWRSQGLHKALLVPSRSLQAFKRGVRHPPGLSAVDGGRYGPIIAALGRLIDNALFVFIVMASLPVFAPDSERTEAVI